MRPSRATPAPTDERLAGATAHVHVVLVVEDDADSREALAAVLEAEGMRVMCAEDGEAALAKLGDGITPCVILLDVGMPGIGADGFRRAQDADARHRDCPVVLVSGRDMREEAVGLGVGEALLKPVDPDELLRVIARNCHRNHERDA